MNTCMPAIQWLWHSSGSIKCKNWPFDRILIKWYWIFFIFNATQGSEIHYRIQRNFHDSSAIIKNDLTPSPKYIW